MTARGPEAGGGGERAVTNFAADFIGWREAAKRLTKERNAIRCEHEEPKRVYGEPSVPDGRVYEEPCWKKYRHDSLRNAGYEPSSWEQWCAACKERERTQDAYRAAIAKRTGALRSLTIAVLSLAKEQP